MVGKVLLCHPLLFSVGSSGEPAPESCTRQRPRRPTWRVSRQSTRGWPRSSEWGHSAAREPCCKDQLSVTAWLLTVTHCYWLSLSVTDCYCYWCCWLFSLSSQSRGGGISSLTNSFLPFLFFSSCSDSFCIWSISLSITVLICIDQCSLSFH